MGCNHSLLQGIFPTQGSNPQLLHCRQIISHRITLETLFHHDFNKPATKVLPSMLGVVGLLQQAWPERPQP